MKNVTQISTESLVIIGSNFISDSLFTDYRRNGKFKVSLANDTNAITNKPDYIIDCSLDKFKQNQTITYSNINNIKKILIINHWERTDLPISNIPILQAIVYDVYGYEHMSFNRPGSGNNTDDDINYCTLISEAIRRIHESKDNFIPITYIPYGEDSIKYLHIDNLYEPINYMLVTLNKSCSFSIYDDDKSINMIVNIIKDIIGYTGRTVITKDKRLYTKYVKSLDFNFKKNSINYEIKKIYNYLLMNNIRFELKY